MKTNKDKVKEMHKKETTWSTSIRAGSVQQNKARKSLKYTMNETMKYFWPPMELNGKECKHIMQPIIKLGLS